MLEACYANMQLYKDIPMLLQLFDWHVHWVRSEKKQETHQSEQGGGEDEWESKSVSAQCWQPDEDQLYVNQLQNR